METDYDLIVVGAGAGGAVVAARVSEDPRIRVLVIESGPDYPNLEALPEDLRDGNRGCSSRTIGGSATAPARRAASRRSPRGRVTGGSRAVNTAIALRGLPSDYDEWASLGNPEWAGRRSSPPSACSKPISTSTPTYHGTAGPIPIRRHTRDELVPYQAAYLDACRRLGYPDCRTTTTRRAPATRPTR